MFMFRFLSALISSLLILSPVKGEDAEYVWRGTGGNAWGTLSNWSPSVAPGAQSSAYTHWMTTNGADSVGRTDVGGLGSDGRYLKGVRVEGVNTQPGGKIQLFIKNTNEKDYLRIQDGGITVANTRTGGYNADLGIAQ